MKKLIVLVAFALASLPAFAQSQGALYANSVFADNGRPAPGATIRVCSAPGTPCTIGSLVIYSDEAMTSVLANPFTADTHGNFYFYTPSRQDVCVQISGSGITTYNIGNPASCDVRMTEPAGAYRSQASALIPDYFSSNDTTLEVAGSSDGTGTVVAARSGTLQTPNLSVTGVANVTQLATPSAPLVTPTLGTASTWTYTIVAKAGSGTTVASPTGSTAVGAATLDATHFNTITWSAVAGASSYDIYRTVTATSPATTGKIGNVLPSATLSLVDNGLAGDGLASPTSNTTGIVTAYQVVTTGPATIDGLEAAAPATPSANHDVLYPKTSTGWCQKNSSGTETCITGHGQSTYNSYGTGTCTASSTLTLFMLGTISQSCIGTSTNFGTVMVSAGTIQNIKAFAITGGVNASSGVLTFKKNGSNFSPSITCTFGTGTTCTPSQQTGTVAANDVITATLTTQAAETLASITVFYEKVN
jgi:hypothetical protein